jgi:hypothetical protein
MWVFRGKPGVKSGYGLRRRCACTALVSSRERVRGEVCERGEVIGGFVREF